MLFLITKVTKLFVLRVDNLEENCVLLFEKQRYL